MNNPTIVRFKADTDEYNKKVKQAKDQLTSFGQGGKQAGAMLGQFDKVMGTSIGTIGKLSMGIGAVTAALSVAKDAFAKNEEHLDAWNQVVESSKSVYEGFLSALNTGDIGGFLKNIDDIVDAATKAYNALDNLGTFNAFNQVNTAKTKAGLDNAIAAYKEGTGSKAAVEHAKKAYIAELKTRQKLEEDAYNQSIRKYAAERGADPKMFAEAMKGTYGNYESLKKTKLTGRTPIMMSTQYGTSYKIGEKAVAANKKEALGEVLRQFNDTELQELQALGAKAFQTSQEIAAISKSTAKILKPKTKTTTTKGKPRDTSIKVDPASLGLTGLGMESVDTGDGKLPAIKVPVEAAIDYQSIIEAQEALDELQAAADAEKLFGAWNDAANGISAVGSALSSIDDPAAKVLGIIAEAIATIALTFAKSLKGTFTPWDWIAGAATGAATMVSTIAAIKSATAEYHANGGFVGQGIKRGTDVVPAMLTPGELVLNKAQQVNVAEGLRQNSLSNLHLETRVRNEDMVICLNAGSVRRGRGEYLTSKSR
jgi:hypothetical protein